MGGQASGGGTSGKVDYPEYMKTQHETWLDDMAASITTAVTGDNPFTGAVAYDPATPIADTAAVLALFNGVVVALDPSSDWEDEYTRAKSALTDINFDSLLIDVNGQVATHKAILDDDLITTVLPSFKRGMQNVSADLSSAFVIGEAIIRKRRDDQLDKFQSEIELKNADLNVKQNTLLIEYEKVILQATQTISTQIQQEIEAYKILTHYTSEVNRVKVVMLKEQDETDLEYDVQDARWDLGMYVEGGNMLAAISGAAVGQGTKGPTKAQSAIGGAMSGAAAGASVGSIVPGVGTAVGAGVGALLGLASGLL